MTTVNLVMVAGRLTRDPVVRQTANGSAVADLGVAINERYKNSAGEEVSRKCFVDVTVWGRQAEVCGKFLRKGAGVLIEGTLTLDQWESGNGERRSRLKVVADRVHFLGRGAGEENERHGASMAAGRLGVPTDRSGRLPGAAGDPPVPIGIQSGKESSAGRWATCSDKGSKQHSGGRNRACE